MNRVKLFFLVLWQLPQYLLGVFLLLSTKNIGQRQTGHSIDYWYAPGFPGNISLGHIIILSWQDMRSPQWIRLLKHEHGHSRQSLIFGPLYLLVVGLPSILTAWLGIQWPGGWPEAQADRLGGVERL